MRSWLFLSVAILGCAEDKPGATGSVAGSKKDTAVKTVDSGPIPPGVVELSSASAVLDDSQVVRFEINYRFTSGAPVKTYLSNVKFPGTDQAGIKPLESFELKPEGSFKMGIEVGDNKVESFEITFSEADSPDRGYTVISNTLTGAVRSSPQ